MLDECGGYGREANSFQPTTARRYGQQGELGERERIRGNLRKLEREQNQVILVNNEKPKWSKGYPESL